MAWLGLAGGGAVSSKMDVTLGGGNFMGQGCYAVSLPAALAVAGRTLPLAPHWLGEPLRLPRGLTPARPYPYA